MRKIDEFEANRIYSKRCRAGWIILACVTVCLVGSAAYGGHICDTNYDNVWGLIIILGGICLSCTGLVIGMKLNRVGYCPYCESQMGRGCLRINKCPHCGGRL